MLTAEQIEVRRRYCGASDAPAICGVDPYRNAADVYASKVHQLENRETEAMKLGNVLEPVLMTLAEEHLGVPITRRGEHVVHGNGLLACTLDGAARINGSMAVIQVKTTGIIAGWGDPDDKDDPDAVPDKVLTQTAIELYVTGWELVYVPVILGRHGLTFKLYRIDRDDELCEAVANRCERFMEEHVNKRIPPPDVLPSLETLKRIRRQPESVAQVSNDVGAELLAAKDELKLAKGREKAALEAFLEAMGDAEGAVTPDYGTWTYFAHPRSGFTVAPHPGIRTLRHKEPGR